MCLYGLPNEKQPHLMIHERNPEVIHLEASRPSASPFVGSEALSLVRFNSAYAAKRLAIAEPVVLLTWTLPGAGRV